MHEILPGRPPLPYVWKMDGVTLPPELERYAADAVADGRYRDRGDVVADALTLLRRRDTARADLLASVRAAEEEADRDGWLSADEVVERAQATIIRRSGAAV